MADKPQSFMVEDAQIIYRNFAGKEGQFNREGSRNFAVILDQEHAAAMAEDGWNVKETKVREDEEDPDAVGVPYISVEVSYKHKPPKIVMITSNSRAHLGEDEVEVLDYTDIKTVDLIAVAYEWRVGGKTGIKAYLKSMFVTIEEDALERKYAQKFKDQEAKD